MAPGIVASFAGCQRGTKRWFGGRGPWAGGMGQEVAAGQAWMEREENGEVAAGQEDMSMMSCVEIVQIRHNQDVPGGGCPGGRMSQGRMVIRTFLTTSLCLRASGERAVSEHVM